MKMTTGFERVFRPIKIAGYTGPQIYREIYMHYLHFLNEDGTILKSKLDNIIEGKYYKEAINNKERSMLDETEYKFPDGQTKRLLALSTDIYGRPILPQI